MSRRHLQLPGHGLERFGGEPAELILEILEDLDDRPLLAVVFPDDGAGGRAFRRNARSFRARGRSAASRDPALVLVWHR
jgi:hypothetical protein